MSKKISTVLVVDDDPTHGRFLEGVLTNNGYTVTVSSEAAEGLQIAMDEDLDLIILDVMMPIINGYNFCKLLKSEEHKKHIPIILITSRDREEDIKIGFEMGAEVYLTKPIKTEELLKAIQMIGSMNND